MTPYWLGRNDFMVCTICGTNHDTTGCPPPIITESSHVDFVGPIVCGDGHRIRDGEDVHYTTCQQPPDHSGPHVGLISWWVGS